MADPFLGEIRPFPYNFAPRNWAFCAGQLLSIAQNQALFALLGTTYGGNGTTTFALPNLQNRTPIGVGQGIGLSSITLGQTAGQSEVTLNLSQIPQHNHMVKVDTTPDTTSPVGAYPSHSGTHGLFDPAINTAFNPQAVGVTGNTEPHDNMQPYLGMNFCICLAGIFPSQN